MAHCGLFTILFCVIAKQTLCTEIQETGLNRFIRRNAHEDYDESNTVIIHPINSLDVMPRTDNRNTIDSNWPRPRPRCNKRIRIQNGVTRFRDKGSLVRYECSFGFSLFGAKLAVCLRDQWSEPPPICVKLGCRRLQKPSNAMARLNFGGAVVAFSCNDGYRMIGRPVLYCDGNHWNGTEPSCLYIPPPTTTIPTTSIIETTQITMEENELSSDKFASTENAEAWDYNPVSTSLATQQPSITSKSISDDLLINRNDPSEHQVIVNQSITQADSKVGNHTITEELVTTDKSIIISLPPTTTTTFEHITSVPIIEPQTSSVVIRETTTETPVPKLPTAILPKVTEREIKLSTSTTTIKPRYVRHPSNPTGPSEPIMTTKKPAKTSTTKLTTTTTKKPTTTIQSTTETISEDSFPFPDNTFDHTFDEGIPKPSEVPEFIHPIAPHKLDTNDSHEYYHKVAQMSIVGGIILIVIGSLSLTGGIVMYCWRKNKGIARAHSWDTDGRTLSPSDANDDFMWMESRDSRL